jgi:simple sugar transport system permease protein
MSADSLAGRLIRIRYGLAEFPEAIALTSFVIVALVFSFGAEHFLTAVSISNILSFSSILGIIVIGVAMLMIAGEFDLSVGSTFAVASFILAVTMEAGMPALPAMLLSLLVSGLLGAINGVIVIRTGIPSFIATLGTMLAYRGIARWIGEGGLKKYTGPTPALFGILNGAVTPLNQVFEPVANFRVSILWFVLIAVVAAIVMRRTQFGNWVFATGGNPGAAMAQGVPVKRVKLMTFTIVGLLTGLASVMQFAQRTSVDPLRGAGWELIAVAACVIGGVQLTGGIGTIFGAIVGILMLQTLEQGLVLMGLSVQIFRAVAGLILMLSVILNTYLLRSD